MEIGLAFQFGVSFPSSQRVRHSIQRCPAALSARPFCQKPHSRQIRFPVHTHVVSMDTLVLTEENVCLALEEAKEKLGSIFGNFEDNRKVGITGDVELASLDGPVVVLRLKGRFWHKRADVLARVSAFLMQRIPEICDTEIEDVQQLEDSEEESSRL